MALTNTQTLPEWLEDILEALGYDGGSVTAGGGIKAQGLAAAGAAHSGNPVLMGLSDGTNARRVLGDTSGRAMIVGAAADNTAATGNPLLIAVQSGSNARTLGGEIQSSDTGSAGALVAAAVNAVQMYINGSTKERARNNFEATVLASAARTGTTNSADQVNYNARGVYLFLNVTANPGGAETLTFNVQIKDPISGNYLTVLSTGALSAFGGAATGMEVLMLYPAIVETAAIANSAPQAIALPRTWRLNVVHSAAGSWTYSAAAAHIL